MSLCAYEPLLLERLPNPEARPEPSLGGLAVVALGEVPVELEAAPELEGEAPADGGFRVGEAAVAGEAERLAVEVRGADVEEDRSANLLQRHNRRGENVDEREAELDVREARVLPDQRAEVVTAHGVQATEVIDVRRVAVRPRGVQTRGDEGAGADRNVLPVVDRHVGRQRAACVGSALRVRRVRRAQLV